MDMNTLSDFYKKPPVGGHILQCKCSASAANIVGSASTAIKEYLLSFFPKNFFNTIYIDKELGTSNMEDYDNDILRRKPALVISPKLQFTDDNNFQYTPDWTSLAKYTYVDKKNFYNSVIEDPIEKIFLFGVPDRFHIDFDISIYQPTYTSQVNTAYYLKQSMHQKGFDKIRPIMESEIPKYLIYSIGNALGLDINNEDDLTKLVSYVNNKSGFKVQRKNNLASGNPFYTMINFTNFIIENPEYPDMDEGNEDGQTKDNFAITFQLRVEFWSPMTFILETGRKFNPEEIPFEDGLQDADIGAVYYHTVKFAPVTDLYDKKLYLWESFVTDNMYKVKINDEVKKDTLCFESLIPLAIRRAFYNQYSLRDVINKKVKGEFVCIDGNYFIDEDLSTDTLKDAEYYCILTDGDNEPDETSLPNVVMIDNKIRIDWENIEYDYNKNYHIVFYDADRKMIDRYIFKLHRLIQLNDQNKPRLYQYIVMIDDEALSVDKHNLDISSFTINLNEPYVDKTYHFAFYLNMTMIKELQDEYEEEQKRAKKK